jgi:SAM-dependent methyltransferase
MQTRQAQKSADFWDKEYETQEHFALSKNPSEDLEKFCRYIDRQWDGFPPNWNVLDVGCGNGRHLIYLAREHAAKGLGFDISKVAISQAKADMSHLLHERGIGGIEFKVGDIGQKLPGHDGAYDLLLDMMSSHMLPESKRAPYAAECARVLSPGSWLLLKTFLLDEDMHAKRMIVENPARNADGTAEKNSYLHPRLGYLEHVYTIREIEELYSPYFHIEKVLKSHAHIVDGKPNKRRFMCIYMTKKK